MAYLSTLHIISFTCSARAIDIMKNRYIRGILTQVLCWRHEMWEDTGGHGEGGERHEKVLVLCVYINIGLRSMDYINIIWRFAMPSVFFTLPSIVTAATVLRPFQKCIGNKGFHTLIAYTYYLSFSCVSSSYPPLSRFCWIK